MFSPVITTDETVSLYYLELQSILFRHFLPVAKVSYWNLTHTAASL